MVAAGVRAAGRAVAAPADLPPPVAEPDDVERTIETILGRAEFRPPPRNPIERAQEWVFEKIGELLDRAFSGGSGTIISLIVLGLASAALAYFLFKLIRGVRRDAVQHALEEADAGRPAELWLADAAAHEAKGEWKAALRCRHRALVAHLSGRGLVDEIPGRTAGEYRREVTSNLPAAAPAFSGATELFELAWYGDRPTGPDENDRFQSLAGSVLAAAGR